MNYFNKVVYVMYIRVESNNIKATIIKSNVQKNDNQKNNILKNKIRRRSDFGVWRRFGNSKNKKCNQTMYFVYVYTRTILLKYYV